VFQHLTTGLSLIFAVSSSSESESAAEAALLLEDKFYQANYNKITDSTSNSGINITIPLLLFLIAPNSIWINAKT